MKSFKPNMSKAPIYNPYDKFPKHDFDAWIGGITGALRKALAHEEEPEPEPEPEKQNEWYHELFSQANGRAADSESSGEEELVDDSFAEIRARRVKGKGRDPREGPGLSAGTFNEPIELESDEDESSEEAEESQSEEIEEEEEEEEEEYEEEDLEDLVAGPSREIHESDEDEEQPLSENTAFPLDVEHEDSSNSQLLDLPDPWKGPKTYAQDFYSGGDVISNDTFPLSADVLNEYDENDNASDAGLFLTPGILTPNGAHAVPSVNSSPVLDFEDSDNHVQEEIPGSSLFAMSPDRKTYDDIDERPDPLYIISDEEEEGNQYEIHERSSPPAEYERSSPPAEYEQDADTEGDGYRDEGDANETILPLGTSDLDIMDEANVEVEKEDVDEDELVDEDTEDAVKDVDKGEVVDQALLADFPSAEDLDAPVEELSTSDQIIEVSYETHKADSSALESGSIVVNEVLNGQSETNGSQRVEEASSVLSESVVVKESHLDASGTSEGVGKASSPLPESIIDSLPDASEGPGMRNVHPPLTEFFISTQTEESVVKAEVGGTGASRSSKAEINAESFSLLLQAQISEDEEDAGGEGAIKEEDKGGDTYSVIEMLSEEDLDLDADFDIESVGPDTDTAVDALRCDVEEVMTEGRLTVEPEYRERSASYVNVDLLEEPEEESAQYLATEAEGEGIDQDQAVAVVDSEMLVDVSSSEANIPVQSDSSQPSMPSKLDLSEANMTSSQSFVLSEGNVVSSVNGSVSEQLEPATEADTPLSVDSGGREVLETEVDASHSLLSQFPTGDSHLEAEVNHVTAQQVVVETQILEQQEPSEDSVFQTTVTTASIFPEEDLTSQSTTAPIIVQHGPVTLQVPSREDLPSPQSVASSIDLQDGLLTLQTPSREDVDPQVSSNVLQNGVYSLQATAPIPAYENTVPHSMSLSALPQNELSMLHNVTSVAESPALALESASTSTSSHLPEPDLPTMAIPTLHAESYPASLSTLATHLPEPDLLTRKAMAIPVLHADPYPASLSTPDVDHVEEDEEEIDEIDEIEQDGDSSNSSMAMETEKDNPKVNGGVLLAEAGEELDAELQYPASPGTESSAHTAAVPADLVPAPLADEHDPDAEGDVDPDFAESFITSFASATDEGLLDAERMIVEHQGNLGPYVSLPELDTSHAPVVNSNPRSSTSNPSVNLDDKDTAEDAREGKVNTAAQILTYPEDTQISVFPKDTLAVEATKDETIVVENSSVEPQTKQEDAISSSPPAGHTTIPDEPDLNASALSDEKSERGEVSGGTDDKPAANHSAVKAESPHGLSSVPPAAGVHLIESPPFSKRPVDTAAETGAESQTHRNERKRKTETTAEIENEVPAKKPKAPSKGKGKKKEMAQDISDTTSNSSASAAAKMLTGSRASSVVSTSTVGDGFSQNPSPTPVRKNDSLFKSTGPPLPPPPPPLPQLMFHNHGRKPAPVRPALSLQTEVQTTVARAPSISDVNAASSSQKISPVAGSTDSRHSSRGLTPSPSILRREASTNSPVTRSHCRYHKISLPEDEDGGSHIFFLVPGCSLVDRKLIKEEEIVDHGHATYEDSIRKVADIETLGINDYVTGVIRLLVGPDKEHEVYFMPKAGEERARRVVHRKSRRSRAVNSSAGLSPRTSHAPTPGNIFSPSSSSRSVAPVSASGSSSTNRPGKGGYGQYAETSAMDTDDDVNDSDDYSPTEKVYQAQDISQGSTNQDTSSFPVAESASVGSSRPRAKKRKRPLDNSVAAYTPGEDNEAEDGDLPSKPKRKKNAVKRAKTSEASISGSTANEEPDRRRKTLKVIS